MTHTALSQETLLDVVGHAEDLRQDSLGIWRPSASYRPGTRMQGANDRRHSHGPASDLTDRYNPWHEDLSLLSADRTMPCASTSVPYAPRSRPLYTMLMVRKLLLLLTLCAGVRLRRKPRLRNAHLHLLPGQARDPQDPLPRSHHPHLQKARHGEYRLLGSAGRRQEPR